LNQHEEDKKEEIEEEKVTKKHIPQKKKDKGNLVSEKNFPNLEDNVPEKTEYKKATIIPEGGTLEELEYSENLGLGTLDKNDIVGENIGPTEEELEDQRQAQW
jgi:hypothetical protein